MVLLPLPPYLTVVIQSLTIYPFVSIQQSAALPAGRSTVDIGLILQCNIKVPKQ
jgi:hypothetical protein